MILVGNIIAAARKVFRCGDTISAHMSKNML